jgi:hypothetical protein
MNPNELNLSHRRPVELVQEAENGRLTRGLRKERPRISSSQTGSRGRMARLHEALALWGDQRPVLPGLGITLRKVRRRR